MQIQRQQDWDYRQPAIYMLTLTLAERRPLLGQLIMEEVNGEPIPEFAHIKESAIGKAAIDSLMELQSKTTELQVLQFQLMPDHLHIALRIKEQMEQPLGTIIRIYKRLSEKRMREASLSSMGVPDHHQPTPLWAPGFNDNRLRTRGQLQHMIAYIQDNPRRLAIKTLHRDLFTIQRGKEYAGTAFDTLGNISLLDRELQAVHVGSRWSAEEKRNYKNGCILAARQGKVLIGAFISEDEKAVKRVALEEKLPMIQLQENGFPELYKPAGEFFDACAEGRLLLMAPWPYHVRRHTISREQCKALNQMAEQLATR